MTRTRILPFEDLAMSILEAAKETSGPRRSP